MVVKTKVLHIIEVSGFKKNINVLKNELFNCFNIQKKFYLITFTATVATAEKTVLILFSYDNNNNHNNHLFKLFISI